MSRLGFRICKSFTVESGHMLSKHAERCRFPHGHTRTIEVVVASEKLDSNDMVLDFKALKLAVSDYIERYDHAMAVNSNDPLIEAIRQVHPDSLIVFEDTDPTTEAMAKDIFDFIFALFENGWGNNQYEIPAKKIILERVRVWETPQSWAEYGQ